MSAQGVRQRKGTKAQPPPEQGVVVQALKKFDVYAKVHDDYKVKTRVGGIISIVSTTMMVYLFVNELLTYLEVDHIDHVMVDTNLNQKLDIRLNITFPHLRCDEVSVDTVDSSGENQVAISGTLHQLELDSAGHLAHDRQAKEGDCWSCLEADEDPPVEGDCCNTCQDLKDAYRAKGLSYYHVLDTAKQCNLAQGCQIFGDVLVNKVGGNVHVALGKSVIRDGKHVHEFNIHDIGDGFNTSHIFHKIRFGDDAPGLGYPLEGTRRTVKEGAGMFHYYIKLVPTLYTGSQGVIYTHQYSVTDTAKNVMLRKGELTGLPGIFLVYEFSPFLVQRVEKTEPFTHFLTQICAIIGGVFTIAGIIDDFLYRGYKNLFGRHVGEAAKDAAQRTL